MSVKWLGSKFVAGAAVLAVVSAVIAPSSASAYTGAPPWIANEGVGGIRGNVLLYDVNGNQLTSGSDYTSFATFVAADSTSGDVTNPGTGASSYAAVPTIGNVSTPANFSSNSLKLNYQWGTAVTLPASMQALQTSLIPFTQLAVSGQNPVGRVSAINKDTSTGYENVLEIRLVNNGAGANGVTQQGGYWRTVIEYNPLAATTTFDGLAPGAWKVIYPVVAAKLDVTVSTPAATPSTQPAPYNVAPLLSVTVTGSDNAHPTGAVEFYDGTFDLGAGTYNASTGVATIQLPAQVDSTYQFSAKFTPDSAAFATYNSGQSGILTYVVNPAVVVVNPPTSQTSVTTTGAHVVDQTLTCINGTWSNTPTSFTYAWLLNGSTISGKTTNKLLQTAAMVGKNVICRVTATNSGGSGYDDSAAGVVAKANFVNKAKPAIGGVLKVGKLLTASNGTWTPAGTSYTYQWKRGSVVIGRAKTYKATAKDKGKILVVIVTAARAGYNSRAISSLGKKIS